VIDLDEATSSSLQKEVGSLKKSQLQSMPLRTQVDRGVQCQLSKIE
jgi:hypothetical protein